MSMTFYAVYLNIYAKKFNFFTVLPVIMVLFFYHFGYIHDHHDNAVFFEFFPTKTDDGQTKLLATFDELNALKPQYFSVTYGAGGSTRERTLGIVKALSEKVIRPSPRIYPVLAMIKPKLASYWIIINR